MLGEWHCYFSESFASVICIFLGLYKGLWNVEFEFQQSIKRLHALNLTPYYVWHR